ncbi:MAG: hypothetical protein ABI647_17660, partial [Gemmatimonadota bacterium]
MQEIASGDLELLTVQYDSLVARLCRVAVLRGIADNTGEYRGFRVRSAIPCVRPTRGSLAGGGHAGD